MYYVFFASIFGLIIGSFLNVVIHRIPRGESIVSPGSHCPACRNPIGAFDNIPLLSYVLLRGRCRNCNIRVSSVYPFVEAITALLFIAIILKSGPSWQAMLEMIFACVMLALVFIDARHHLLPNMITYPAFLFALAAATVLGGLGDWASGTIGISIVIPALELGISPLRAALIGGFLFALAAPGFWLLDRLDLVLFNKYFEWEEMNEEGERDEEAIESRYRLTIYGTMIAGLLVAAGWAFAVIYFSPNEPQAFDDAYKGLLGASGGALLGGGLIWWLRAVYFYIRGFEGMGLGDVKMMAIVGAFLGWRGTFGVLLLGSIIGVVVGSILAFRGKQGFKTPLPFGVCLGIASLIVLLIAKH